MRVAIVVGVCVLALSACTSQVDGAKDAAAAELRDPSSAQFREVEAVDGAVCGEINGKNAYGGYAGFTRFYVTDAGEVGVEENNTPMSGVVEETDRLNRRTAFLRGYTAACFP